VRLCWLIPDDRGGGVASVALSCCRQAAAAGHEVTLLMALPPTGHLAEYAEGFALDSLHIESQSPDGPQRLVQWLRDHPQDVLFLNGCSEVEPALPYIPQRTHSVYVVHDTVPMYWTTAVENEAVLDGIVVVSETVARQFRDELQTPEKLHVAHNGTVFPPPPDATDRANDLLFLGGGQPLKGKDDVLDVWTALADREFDGRLHWYGRLDNQMREKITNGPAAERVEIHGRVPRSDIFERAARSKVLLMLSRDEPFGMATVEAMGMGGLPVAWDIDTGTREIVEDGKTGFFAPLGDAEAAADRIFEACRRHGELHEAAMQTARTQFSEEAMWTRYEEVLGDLTSQSPVSRPHAGNEPPPFEPPTRYFQLLPDALRTRIRSFIGRFPQLEYWLRDWKGF
jgi:glycosyltransferase involved in cell wall biosynthesis